MSVYIHLWLSLAQSGVSSSLGQVSAPQHLLSVKEKTVTGKASLFQINPLQTELKSI